MKKICLLLSAIFITNIANARTERYASIKIGAGDTTIYVDDDTKLGDYLVAASGDGYAFNSSGLLWEMSAAVGVEWPLSNMYVTPSRYDWMRLRLEGEFGYNRYREDGKLKYSYTVTDKTKVKMDQFFLLANGYADFRIDKTVPYIGVGFGYSFGKEELTISNSMGEFNNSVDDNGIIYALHAGVAYKYSDTTTLDLGYRRVYAPAKDDGLNVFSTLRFGWRVRV